MTVPEAWTVEMAGMPNEARRISARDPATGDLVYVLASEIARPADSSEKILNLKVAQKWAAGSIEKVGGAPARWHTPHPEASHALRFPLPMRAKGPLFASSQKGRTAVQAWSWHGPTWLYAIYTVSAPERRGSMLRLAKTLTHTPQTTAVQALTPLTWKQKNATYLPAVA